MNGRPRSGLLQNRHLRGNLDAEAFETNHFARVVGQQANPVQTEVSQDLGAESGFVLEYGGARGGGVVSGSRPWATISPWRCW